MHQVIPIHLLYIERGLRPNQRTNLVHLQSAEPHIFKRLPHYTKTVSPIRHMCVYYPIHSKTMAY